MQPIFVERFCIDDSKRISVCINSNSVSLDKTATLKEWRNVVMKKKWIMTCNDTTNGLKTKASADIALSRAILRKPLFAVLTTEKCKS